MENYNNITKIRTGRVAGAHIAVLYAPENASAGSLGSLVQFLNEQPDVKAMPGYEGAQQHHVLRISGLENDEGLKNLLIQDYPQWCRQQGIEPAISLAGDATFEAIDKVESFPFKSPIDKFITEHANGLTGAAYMTGNMGVLYSGWTNGKSHGKTHDWLKISSAAAYNISSVLLAVLGNGADNPRDAYSILEQTYPTIKEADGKVKNQIHDNTERVLNFVKKHPWEVCGVTSFTGASLYLASCVKRGVAMSPFETISTLGTMTGMLIQTLVPEKGGKEQIDISDAFSGKNQTLLSTAQMMTSTPEHTRHSVGMMEKISEAIGGHPLKVSANIAAISNIGYGVEGIMKNDKGLMGMSAGYLAGNISQAKATKGQGASFDALVSAAADMMHADPAVAHMDKAALSERVNDVVNLLYAQRDVMHSKNAMTAGIASRLERYQPTTTIGEPLLTGFLAEEAGILSSSPFLSPHTLNLAARCEQTLHPQR